MVNYMEFHELDVRMQVMTPHQMKIIQAIYNAGGNWLTRSKVAKSLGKRRLTPYDITCLQMLSDNSIIETSTQPTTAPGSDFAYIYHMPNAVADILQKWSESQENESQVHQRKPINIVDD